MNRWEKTMSKSRSFICIEIYSDVVIVVDVRKCKNCGREYAEVSDICDDYKICPYCGVEIGGDDAS